MTAVKAQMCARMKERETVTLRYVGTDPKEQLTWKFFQDNPLILERAVRAYLKHNKGKKNDASNS